MKLLLLMISIACVLIAAGCSRPDAPAASTINPLLGDASFVQRFGRAPVAGTDDALRI